jgi:probable F420-dependent oxidoreductase
MGVSFGLGLPVVQQLPDRAQAWEAEAGGRELVRIATLADRLGFSHVSCSDHVLVPDSRVATMGAPWYDAAVTLAFLASVTERIGLLSHIVVLPYRHPLVTAKAFGTLDRLANGRVVLGVGTGHVKAEFKILGVEYARRGRLTDEYIEAIREAWGSERPAFDGPTVRFRNLRVEPRPVRREAARVGPPIWIGGNTRAAVRRAASHGDGWIPWRVTYEDFASGVKEARAMAQDAGRRNGLEFVAPLQVTTDDDAEGVRERVSRWQRAGATRMHVVFAHRSLEELLGRIEWFAAFVMPDVAVPGTPRG